MYWERGLDSGKRGLARLLLSFLWIQTICCQQLQHFNWWYLYIYSQYLCYANVFMISVDLVTFSTLFMFVMTSLMNYANTSSIIIGLYWFWLANICHVINLVLSSIYIYMIYVFTVWSLSNSEFLFEYCQDYLHSRIIGNLIPG